MKYLVRVAIVISILAAAKGALADDMGQDDPDVNRLTKLYGGPIPAISDAEGDKVVERILGRGKN